MAAPRYGLSIPDRGVLYGVTTVGQILDQAAQAGRALLDVLPEAAWFTVPA